LIAPSEAVSAAFWSICYSASSERKLLLHKLMCIVLSDVVIALCRAIRVVCLHDVSMLAIGVEGADQGEEEPSHHHVAPGMSLPHKPSQYPHMRVVSSGCNRLPRPGFSLPMIGHHK
jgi:hypothetical protein